MDRGTSWYTTYLNIFRNHYDIDEPLQFMYLSLIGLKSIEWPQSGIRICPSCGNSTGEWPCSGCQSMESAGNSLGRAKVTLYGPMPIAMSIFSFHPDTTFHANITHLGDRQLLYNRDGFMRFTDCAIVRRIMPGIYSADPEGHDRIYLQVVMECNVELFIEGLPDGR